MYGKEGNLSSQNRIFGEILRACGPTFLFYYVFVSAVSKAKDITTCPNPKLVRRRSVQLIEFWNFSMR